MRNKLLQNKHKRTAKAKRLAAMTGALTTAAVLTMGAAAPRVRSPPTRAT